MKRFMISAILVFITATSYAQNDVLKILNDQIEAFNSADIQKLVDNVSDDFRWYYIGSDTLMLEVDGKVQFKKSMESYFGYVKNVKSEIVSYSIDGDRISYQEKVVYDTKSGEQKSATAMAIYQMKDGLIYRVWYFF